MLFCQRGFPPLGDLPPASSLLLPRFDSSMVMSFLFFSVMLRLLSSLLLCPYFGWALWQWSCPRDSVCHMIVGGSWVFTKAVHTFKSALCYSHILLVHVFLGVQCIKVNFGVCSKLVGLNLVLPFPQLGLGEHASGVHLFDVLLHLLGIACGYTIFQQLSLLFAQLPCIGCDVGHLIPWFHECSPGWFLAVGADLTPCLSNVSNESFCGLIRKTCVVYVALI